MKVEKSSAIAYLEVQGIVYLEYQGMQDACGRGQSIGIFQMLPQKPLGDEKRTAGDIPIMKLAAFAFVLATTAAMAQPETVTVAQSLGLDGFWKISVPAGFSIGFSGPAQFGPMRELYCRITRNGGIHCLSGGYAQSGTAVLDEGTVHIAWGSMMARMAIDAEYTGSSLTGTFTFRLSGIRHDAPGPSIGERIMPPRGSDDASQYLTALMTQLAADRITSPLDAKAIAARDGALPNDIGKLGRVEAVAFLGRTPVRIDRPEGDLYSVHIVEFAHGERLCGWHQNRDGVLDAFRCV